MTIDLSNISVAVITSIITVLAAFYLRNHLQEQLDYRKLKNKLESIAGKNAKIVYTGAGSTGGILYKIVEVSKYGLTIKNIAHEVFIPITKVLKMDFILPAENYEELKDESEKKDIEKFSSAMFEPLFEKMAESIEGELTKNNGELSNSLEARVIYILEEKGILKIDNKIEKTQSIEHEG